MSVIGSNILAGASGQGGAYNLDRSLRFRDSASAYLSRTPASAGNRKTWTWSAWVKRGSINRSGQDYALFVVRPSSTPYALITFRHSTATGAYGILFEDSASGSALATSSKYRDPSAWYHIVIAVDTTQATSSNRVKIYVNNQQITSWDTYNTFPSLNADTLVNSTNPHNIGRDPYDTANLFDGYLTEVNFIDGQALTPSDFGATNASTGVWQPKKYAGTYGTNGFYLPFTDNSAATATAIGKDFSGNGNNWTPNNISLTPDFSGSTYTTAGTYTWTAPAGVTSIDYLIIGGGGAGGCQSGAGGGAGGYLSGTMSVTAGNSYSITVGAGGTGNTNNGVVGQSGGNSTGFGLTAYGGGGGASRFQYNGASGGSGGGGTSGSAGSGTSGQGYNGASTGNQDVGGGGGGAGGAASGQTGGAGASNSITGTAVTYAVGGSGQSWGNGSTGSSSSTAGSGGGGGAGVDNGRGGDGRTGIVVIKYATSTPTYTSSTYDSMTDVPTLTSKTASNFATLNPLNPTGGTYSDGNLKWVSATTDGRFALSTIAINSTGKWYCEVTIGSKSGQYWQVGAYGNSNTFNPRIQYRSDGATNIDGSSSSTFASYTTGDVIGMAFDASTNQITFYKNNTSQGTLTATTTGVPYYFGCGSDSSGSTSTYDINFGQRPFTYTPPTGFVALNTFNLP